MTMECLDSVRKFLSPEQAAAACDTWQTFYETVWLPLQVPGGAEWKEALRAAFFDSREAISSTAHFWVLTLRPVLIFVSMGIQWFLRLIWKYVIVKGISQQGVLYLTKACRHLYAWQLSLTRKQILIELGTVGSAIVLFYLHRFLKRQTYFKRMSVWARNKVLIVQLYYDRARRYTSKTYERTVRKIATTSLRLAIMMPHLLFVGAAAAAKLLVPSFFAWLACDTALLPVIKLWYPFFATILLLHDMKMVKFNSQQQQVFQTPKKRISSREMTPISRIFPRTTPASEKRRQKRQEGGEIKERESYWLHFWMVSASFICCKSFFAALPFVNRLINRYEWCKPGLVQLELLFYTWVFVMPYLLPQIANAPEGRPLFMLEPRISQTAKVVYKSTLVFSDAWWQRYVISPLTTSLNLLVTLRILSKTFADELRDVVVQSKALLLPSASLFMPRFLSIFGLLFVQYALPLHKQSELRKDRHIMLRYWVTHIILSVIVEATESILWWIPFSRVMIFVAYVIIGTSQAVIEMCVSMILNDLEVFRLLPTTDDASEEARKTSWAARAVHALLERLPKAKDDAHMTPGKHALETAIEEEDTTSIEIPNEIIIESSYAVNLQYSNQYEEDDAMLYPSSDDLDAGSSSKGSAVVSHATDSQKSDSEQVQVLQKDSTRSKTKRKVAVDKENVKNVQPTPARRSGRHRTRTQRLS